MILDVRRFEVVLNLVVVIFENKINNIIVINIVWVVDGIRILINESWSGCN